MFTSVIALQKGRISVININGKLSNILHIIVQMDSFFQIYVLYLINHTSLLEYFKQIYILIKPQSLFNKNFIQLHNGL